MSLPSDYVQLEYIESNGTQYIDTLFQPSKAYGRIQVKFVTLAIGTYYYQYRLAGSYGDSNRYPQLYLGLPTTYIGVGDRDISTGITQTVNVINELDVSFGNGAILYTFNGTAVNLSYSGTSQVAKNVYLFADNEDTMGPAYYCLAKMYYFKIWDGDTLVRDFVPCVNQNNIAGMYDLVNSRFYPSNSNSNFIAGPKKNNTGMPILPTNYTQLEYIKGNGSCYINTGVSFTSSDYSNIRFVVDGIVGTASNGWPVQGAGNASSIHFGCGNNTRNIWYADGYSDINTNVAYTEDRCTFDLDLVNRKFSVKEYSDDNYLINSNITLTSPSHGNTLFLLAYCDNGSAMCNTWTVYRSQIYRSGILIRDFIPCINPSNIIGMYDIVNNVFYSPQGTGSPVAGPEYLFSITKLTQLDGTEIVDISEDTINPSIVLRGKIGCRKDGKLFEGTMSGASSKIKVNTDPNASVTAVSGGTTITGTADGYGVCYLDAGIGTWNITTQGTSGTATGSATINSDTLNRSISVPIEPPKTVTITGQGRQDICYVAINGQQYITATSVQVPSHSIITLFIGYSHGFIIVDGDTVSSAGGSYDLEVTDNVNIYINAESFNEEITVIMNKCLLNITGKGDLERCYIVANDTRYYNNLPQTVLISKNTAFAAYVRGGADFSLAVNGVAQVEGMLVSITATKDTDGIINATLSYLSARIGSIEITGDCHV